MCQRIRHFIQLPIGKALALENKRGLVRRLVYLFSEQFMNAFIPCKRYISLVEIKKNLLLFSLREDRNFVQLDCWILDDLLNN